VNVAVLIDAIVRQTVVLIAELATSGGLRAPLARVADQVFLELSRELDAQGLSRKVSADMFGLALRTYQRKVQRIAESSSDQGRTLWEAVYDFVRSRDVTSRKEVLARFLHDDEEVVRGVLADLVESGLVFSAGPTQDTTFRAASEGELGAMARTLGTSDEIVWALVFRTGPSTAARLTSLGGLGEVDAQAALDRLGIAGRVSRHDGPDGAVYRTTRFVVPLGAQAGWEAAILDHYHAVVRTIVAKLRKAPGTSALDDCIGGSTYGFEVWPGHPLEGEVLGALRQFREQHSALRERVRAHNRAERQKPKVRQAVVLYGGQCVWELEDEEATSG
jgi:hypothetical protein